MKQTQRFKFISIFLCLLALFSIAGCKKDPAKLKSDTEAPSFTAETNDGQTIQLSDFKGKLVVLEWSNYGCPYVVKHYKSNNIPAMQEKYKAKDVVWLTVMSSAPGKQGFYEPEEMAKQNSEFNNKATHVLRDPSGEIGRLYDAKTTPHMYIINKDGILVYHGAIDSISSADMDDIEEADNYVQLALDALINGEEVENKVTAPYGCSIKY